MGRTVVFVATAKLEVTSVSGLVWRSGAGSFVFVFLWPAGGGSDFWTLFSFDWHKKASFDTSGNSPAEKIGVV